LPNVVLLPTGKALTVRASADVFLDSNANPNAVRNYGIFSELLRFPSSIDGMSNVGIPVV
jgi:hypothetical protein